VGDPVRLRQVITNLIGNAIKFTDKGEVVLTVTVDKWNEDNTVTLHFAVADTGIGIPPEKLSVIFEAFSQADGSVTRKYGGTGLGLTISTRLVELMHGRLSAESTAGSGSTFHFTAILGLGKEEQTKPNTKVLEGLGVLVVDDNATNRGVLQNMLQYWKMNVTSVESGAQAILLLQDKNLPPFQYILLDTQMPIVDGFAVAQCLKSLPTLYTGKCTVIMMLSSTAQRGIVEKHADLPISVYLSKPIGQFELLDALLKPFQNSSESQGKYTESQSDSVLAPPSQVNRRGGKILLAEDNVVNQRLVVRLLERLGYSVVVAENGVRAVQSFERESFDLILMDVQMPEMGGFEATSKIRELETTQTRTPIIAMTAHAIQGYREKCLQAGMDGYISKPIRIEVVKKTIEEFLEKSRHPTPIIYM